MWLEAWWGRGWCMWFVGYENFGFHSNCFGKLWEGLSKTDTWSLHFNVLFLNKYRVTGNCKYGTGYYSLSFPYGDILHNLNIKTRNLTLVQFPNLFQTHYFTCMCVCVVLCIFIICADSCKHHQNQNVELFLAGSQKVLSSSQTQTVQVKLRGEGSGGGMCIWRSERY